MKQYIQLSQTSGHVYEIPVAAVAENRAKTMQELHPDEFANIEAAMADTVELFKDSLYDIKDWASNNMNWSDLEPHARLIRFTPPETQFHEGEWTYHDHRAITGEMDGASIMQSPLEATVATMIEAQQLCNVTVLNAEDGKPFGAVAVIVGPPQVVSAYINTLKFTGDQLTAGAAPVPTH